MLAVDTNVVVRYLTGDDPVQSPAARILITENRVFVCTTVLLETEWVLRSTYDYPLERIAKSLRAFSALPTVTLESRAFAEAAFILAEQGLDFADAFHLVQTKHCAAFLTFDRRLTKVGSALTDQEIRSP